MANPETNETTDFLYLLDNSKYLHLQSGTDGYTYSVYDAQTKLKELTGIYPHPAEHFQTACMEICELLHLGKHSVVSSHMDELNVIQALNDYNAERPYRYFITAEALKNGSYPFPDYAEIHETVTPQQYDFGTVTAFGFIDLPSKLTREQENKYHLIPSDSTTSLIRFETEEAMIRAADAGYELEHKKPSLLQKLKSLPQELSHPKQKKKCKEKEDMNAR